MKEPKESFQARSTDLIPSYLVAERILKMTPTIIGTKMIRRKMLIRLMESLLENTGFMWVGISLSS